MNRAPLAVALLLALPLFLVPPAASQAGGLTAIAEPIFINPAGGGPLPLTLTVGLSQQATKAIRIAAPAGATLACPELPLAPVCLAVTDPLSGESFALYLLVPPASEFVTLDASATFDAPLQALPHGSTILWHVTAVGAGPPVQLRQTDAVQRVDRNPPVTTLTVTPPTPDGANGWFMAAPTLSLSAADNVGPAGSNAGLGTIHWAWSGNQDANGTGANPAAPVEGQGDLTFRSEDLAVPANLEANKTATFKLDLTPPVVDVTDLAGGFFPNVPAVAFTVTEAHPDATTCSLDGGAPSPCTSPFTPVVASDGLHSVLVRHTDQAGRPGEDSTNFRLDRIDPVVSITSPAANAVLGTDDVTVTFTATDANLATVRCGLDGGALSACTSPASFSNLDGGSHTVRVNATDAAGRTTEGSATFLMAELHFTTVPSPVQSGVDFGVDVEFRALGGTQRLTAIEQDVTVTLLNAAGAVLGGTTTVPAEDGLAQFSDLTIDLAGEYELRASSASVASNDSGLVQVLAGPAASIVADQASFSDVGAGTGQVLQARVRDANNNLVSGQTVNWTVLLGGGSLSGATSTTNVQGIASITLTTGAVNGTNTARASIGGVGQADFTVTTVAGLASQIAAVGSTSVSGSVDSIMTLTTRVRDSNGNPVGGVTVHWNVTGGGGAFVGGGTSTTSVTSGLGFASIQIVTGTTAGANTVTASRTGLSGSPVTFTITTTAGVASVLTNVTDLTTNNIVAGNPKILEARVEDEFGNPKANHNVNWAVTGGGGSLSAPSSSTNSNGVASVTLTTGTSVGANTVQASAAGLSGSPITFTVNTISGAASRIEAVQGSFVNIVAGAAQELEARVTDTNGNPVSGVSVSWAVTAGGGSRSPASSTTDATGIATTTLTTGTTVATNTVTATSGSLTGSPVTFTVETVAGPAHELQPVDPGPFTVGAGEAKTIQIRARDVHGNVVAGVQINWTVTAGGGALSVANSNTAANGIASVVLTASTSVGSATVEGEGPAGLVNSTISFDVDIVAGAASQLFVTVQPAGAAGGVAFTTQPKVELRDAFGNVRSSDSSSTGSVTIETNPAGGTLSGVTTVTVANGVATFTNLKINKAGNGYTLKFTTSAGSFSTTSSEFNVAVGPAANLAFTTVPSTATSGQAFTAVVQVQDLGGNLVTSSGASITVSKKSGPDLGTLTGTLTRSAASGVATFDDLKLDFAGGYKLQAASGSLTEHTSSTITVAPSAPAELRFEADLGTETSGVAFGALVGVYDAQGNPVQTSTIPITMSRKTGPGTLGGTLTLNADDGLATFNDLTLDDAGSYTLEASASGVTAATSNAFSVVAGAIASIAIANGDEEHTAGDAGTITYTVTAQDAAGNAHAVDSVADILWGINDADGGSLDDNELTPGTLAGAYEIRARLAADTTINDTATLTINAGPVDTILASPEDPNALVGAQVAFTADLLDAFGNPTVSDAIRWTSSNTAVGTIGSQTGLFAAKAVGNTTITVKDTDTLAEATVLVDVVANATLVESITILPTDATIAAGDTQAFHVDAFDADGNPVLGVEADFTLEDEDLALLDENDLTGVVAGSTHLSAEINGATAVANVTIEAGTLVQLDLSPQSAALEPGESLAFSAAGQDAYHNNVALASAAWSVDNETLATVNATTGLLEAGDAEGVVLVTASAGGFNATAAVAITSVVATSGDVTTVNATATGQTVEGVDSTTYAAGFAAVESGAVAELDVPDPTGPATALVDARVTFGAAESDLSLAITTQEPSMTIAPDEVGLVNFTSLLAGLTTADLPGLYVSFGASSGGGELSTNQLNNVVGELNATIRIPASYFSGQDVSPSRVRVAEYSDGELVDDNVSAERLTTSAIQGYHHYRLVLTSFSAFAAFGLPVEEDDGGGGGGNGRGNGGNDDDDDGSESALDLVRLTTGDDWLPRVELDLAQALLNPTASARVSTQRPGGAPELPSGLTALRFVDVRADGLDVVEARFTLALPTTALADPGQAVLLHAVGQEWRVESPASLALENGRYRGVVEASCCSVFAVAVDSTPPQVTLDRPDDAVVTGSSTFAARATDNLQVGRVEFYVDGTLLDSDDSAPYEVALESERFANGAHQLRAVAYDVVDNRAQDSRSTAFRNAGSPAGGASAGDGGSDWGLWIAIGILVLLIGGILGTAVAFSRRRVARRRSARSPPAQA